MSEHSQAELEQVKSQLVSQGLLVEDADINSLPEPVLDELVKCICRGAGLTSDILRVVRNHNN